MSAEIELGSFEFALKLFKTLSSDENLVLSPFSLSCALSMTLLGTRNHSGSQLSNALFGKDYSVNQFDSMVTQFESLIDKCIKTNEKVLFNANFIYSLITYGVLPKFREIIQKRFNAKTQELDFINNESDSIKTINNDICEATKGKIRDFINGIDPLTRLIIVNAVYFKGLWKSQFESQLTSVQKFTTSSGQQLDVDMMFQENKFPFGCCQSLKCKAIELKYESSNISMIVLLPDENSSLQELQSNLNRETLNDLLNSLSSLKVALSLPKFKMESNLRLVPELTKLGIKDIFDPKLANFSGLTEESGLYVSDVIQKAIIEVNEEGTEAAAATGVIMSVMSFEMTEEMNVNRPFMFLMNSKYEEFKNLILFIGAVHNPKA